MPRGQGDFSEEMSLKAEEVLIWRRRWGWEFPAEGKECAKVWRSKKVAPDRRTLRQSVWLGLGRHRGMWKEALVGGLWNSTVRVQIPAPPLYG